MKQFLNIFLFKFLPLLGILFIAQGIYESDYWPTPEVEIGGYYACAVHNRSYSMDRLVKVLATSKDGEKVKTVTMHNIWSAADYAQAKNILDRSDLYLSAINTMNSNIGTLYDNLQLVDIDADSVQKVTILRESADLFNNAIRELSNHVVAIEVFKVGDFKLACNQRDADMLADYWDE